MPEEATMSENPIQAALTPEEWTLIQALRALPESPVRDRVHQVFSELIFFVQNPRCQGMGVEGFPCGEPKASCEECHGVWDALDRLGVPVRS
jgi:hypothetical protein